jgi:hypothetical protein
MRGSRAARRALCALLALAMLVAAGLSTGIVGAQQNATPILDPIRNVIGLTFRATHPPAQPILTRKLIYQDKPNQCYEAIGVALQAGHVTEPDASGKCPSGSVPRTGNDYFQGMGTARGFTITGTSPRLLCGGGGAFRKIILPFQSPDFNVVCEEGAAYDVDKGKPLTFADAHFSPRVVRVDSKTDEATDITPTDGSMTSDVITIRGGAGCESCDIIYIFGQEFFRGGSAEQLKYGNFRLKLFAWQASTGKYLGSVTRPEFLGIREGVEVGGHFYVGARVAAGTALNSTGGKILKFVGDLDHPFDFQEVGDMPGADPAYLTELNGRIVAGTWQRNAPMLVPVGGVWMGPPANKPGGLTPDDDKSWKQIFDWRSVEPDPFMADRTDTGDITSWHGDLYFGSYNPNVMYAMMDHIAKYGRGKTDLDTALMAKNRMRAVYYVRLRNAGTPDQKVDLLYADAKYPVYDPATDKFSMKPNKLTGKRGTYGAAGFGNTANQYEWTTWVFHDRLYVSTFDAITVAASVGPGGFACQRLWLDLEPETCGLLYGVTKSLAATESGGDLWRFDSPDKPAVPEDLRGQGTTSNHGIRLVALYPDKFYVGTATMLNLRTDPNDNPAGAQILKFTDSGQPPPKVARPLQLTLIAVPAQGVAAGAAAAKLSTGVAPSFAEGQGVDINAEVSNYGRPSARNVKVCIRVPNGFRLGSNPTADVTGRSACFDIAKLASNDSKLLVLHTTSEQSPGTARFVGAATGTEVGYNNPKAAGLVTVNVTGPQAASGGQQPRRQGGGVTG